MTRFFFCVIYSMKPRKTQGCHHRFLFVYGSVKIFILNTKSPGLDEKIRLIYLYPPCSACLYPLRFSLQDRQRSQALPFVWGDLPTALRAAQLRAARGEPLEGVPRLLRAVPPELPAAALREARPHALRRPRAQLRPNWVKHAEGRAEIYCMGKCVSSAVSSFWSGFG